MEAKRNVSRCVCDLTQHDKSLQALSTSQHNPAELLCGACSDVAHAQVCPRHGTEYLEYKCRFCCSVAVYFWYVRGLTRRANRCAIIFSFGTTHFCTGCHDDFQRLMSLPKERLPQCPVGPRCVQLEGDCPLRIAKASHAATGEECALGCALCRNVATF